MALRRYGSLANIPSLDNDIWAEYQDTVTGNGLAQGLQIKKLYVDAGDTLIWHPQLPHGGSPIKDRRRTRFSWVIHTTPVGVPVYHQNVFFNPNREFATTPPWGYFEHDGRQIADMRPHGVAFSDRPYPVGRFKGTKIASIKEKSGFHSAKPSACPDGAS
jgi:phytanoyl-CoA hydroxylase